MDLSSPFCDCPLILNNQRQVTRLKMAVVRAPLRVPCNSNAFGKKSLLCLLHANFMRWVLLGCPCWPELLGSVDFLAPASWLARTMGRATRPGSCMWHIKVTEAGWQHRWWSTCGHEGLRFIPSTNACKQICTQEVEGSGPWDTGALLQNNKVTLWIVTASVILMPTRFLRISHNSRNTC